MRRTDEFYEKEKRSHKLNILIAAAALLTLLLTGAVFASNADVDDGTATDIRTVESYEADL